MKVFPFDPLYHFSLSKASDKRRENIIRLLFGRDLILLGWIISAPTYHEYCPTTKPASLLRRGFVILLWVHASAGAEDDSLHQTADVRTGMSVPTQI